MKIAVRYQSRGGNTKAVAVAIAQAVGVTAQSIDVPAGEPVDLLFVGGGIYAFSLDDGLKAFLQGLDPEMVKTVAAFATSGFVGGAGKIAAEAKKRGIAVCDKALNIKLGSGQYGGKALPDKQMVKINEFAKGIIGGITI